MAITRLSIVTIPVSDQDAAKDFYIQNLGFEVVADSMAGPDMRWLQLSLPGAETSITLINWYEMKPGSVDGSVLETDDIVAIHATLTDRGVSITDIQEAPFGKYFNFSDPDGNGWLIRQGA